MNTDIIDSDGLVIVEITKNQINADDNTKNINSEMKKIMKDKGLNHKDFILLRSRKHIIRFAKPIPETKKELKNIVNIYDIHSILNYIHKGKWYRKISNKGYWIYSCTHTIINESTVVMYPYVKDRDILIYECVYKNGADRIMIRKQLVSRIDIDHMSDKLINKNGVLQRTAPWINQAKKDLEILNQHKKISIDAITSLIQLCRNGIIKDRNDLDERVKEMIKKGL